MSIQRYDIEEYQEEYLAASMEESPDGDYVLYTDHAAEVERLTAEIDTLEAQKATYYYRANAAAKERDAAVARAEKAEATLLEIGRLPYCDAYMIKGLARAALSPEPWGGQEGED